MQKVRKHIQDIGVREEEVELLRKEDKNLKEEEGKEIFSSFITLSLDQIIS
jgi:hypothetical protein